MKLHVGLNQGGHIPEFNCIIDGKVHDVTTSKTLDFPSKSIIAIDRAYTDYGWDNTLNNRGIYFVSRQKKNARYRVVERRPVDKR
ncbi:MAG: transposase [Gammaproteobacteria bacterium]|nr:transposase [Gammaproteobacteria bacterium]